MEKRKETKTTLLKAHETGVKNWFIIDANGKTLGRLSSEIAQILRGKHKVTYTPHVHCGDGVIVVNAEKISLSGAKKAQKIYRHYTGHIGGLREIPFETMLVRKPDYILRHAIKGMMPKTNLGRKQMKGLRIFKGADIEGFDAQTPKKLEI